jgi:hypothetical protein
MAWRLVQAIQSAVLLNGMKKDGKEQDATMLIKDGWIKEQLRPCQREDGEMLNVIPEKVSMQTEVEIMLFHDKIKEKQFFFGNEIRL